MLKYRYSVSNYFIYTIRMMRLNFRVIDFWMWGGEKKCQQVQKLVQSNQI